MRAQQKAKARVVFRRIHTAALQRTDRSEGEKPGARSSPREFRF